jgi:ATP adenylyltransferase
MEHLWAPWRMQYVNAHKSYDACVFCVAQTLEDGFENLIVYRGEYAFVILNRYPYNSGHLLVVPYQHVDTLEGLCPEARDELMALATRTVSILSELYHPQGFNLGINLGTAAGAGIAEHLHMHAVPRWGGDTNFISIVGKTRVLPEELSETYQRLYDAWRA